MLNHVVKSIFIEKNSSLLLTLLFFDISLSKNRNFQTQKMHTLVCAMLSAHPSNFFGPCEILTRAPVAHTKILCGLEHVPFVRPGMLMKFSIQFNYKLFSFLNILSLSKKIICKMQTNAFKRKIKKM